MTCVCYLAAKAISLFFLSKFELHQYESRVILQLLDRKKRSLLCIYFSRYVFMYFLVFNRRLNQALLKWFKNKRFGEDKVFIIYNIII